MGGLRFVTPTSINGQGSLSGSPHLQFEGSRQHFELLILIVEVSLHLLRSHLVALTAAVGIGGAAAAAVSAPVSGAPSPPRLALIVQYFRALRQFAGASGGGVAPVEEPSLDMSGFSASSGPRPAPAKVLDLGFAACTAEQVEGLLLELQSLGVTL